ncbi:hypothetical protein SAMN02745116_01225 [Pilibacter termitis]|uniref:Gram-positive cocci surface proteins LPxTG domain-containing protein n=1 Tax=Pilibacter termitis TaxID=263852 RepID=A0A1T4MWC9_9ENTE|nr:hypothetical protein [Pilibacter termitis]SJZ71221.1 hypothetical protein SAMN02745116_01225 [Pilibacter termitis]
MKNRVAFFCFLLSLLIFSGNTKTNADESTVVDDNVNHIRISIPKDVVVEPDMPDGVKPSKTLPDTNATANTTTKTSGSNNLGSFGEEHSAYFTIIGLLLMNLVLLLLILRKRQNEDKEKSIKENVQ